MFSVPNTMSALGLGGVDRVIFDRSGQFNLSVHVCAKGARSHDDVGRPLLTHADWDFRYLGHNLG
jgi:hypothetical protein